MTGFSKAIEPVPPKPKPILIRFRGQFHEIEEGGALPLGCCICHLRMAVEMFGRWTGHYGMSDRSPEPLNSRIHAEQWLLRGSDAPPCEHLRSI